MTNFQSINRIIWFGWHFWIPPSPTLFWKHCSAFSYMNIQILPFALWRENCESVAKQRWGGKLNPSKPSFAYDFSFHVKKWKKEVNSLQSEINRVCATKGSVRSYPCSCKGGLPAKSNSLCSLTSPIWRHFMTDRGKQNFPSWPCILLSRSQLWVVCNTRSLLCLAAFCLHHKKMQADWIMRYLCSGHRKPRVPHKNRWLNEPKPTENLYEAQRHANTVTGPFFAFFFTSWKVDWVSS